MMIYDSLRCKYYLTLVLLIFGLILFTLSFKNFFCRIPFKLIVKEEKISLCII